MSTDSGGLEPRKGTVDLWTVPAILSMEIIHVHYKRPVEFFIKSRPVKIKEAVEFLVKTSKEFPIRALGPALFVGDFAVTEVNHVNRNLYRFIVPAPELEKLKPGAPISIGWSGVESTKITTNLEFQIQREEDR